MTVNEMSDDEPGEIEMNSERGEDDDVSHSTGASNSEDETSSHESSEDEEEDSSSEEESSDRESSSLEEEEEVGGDSSSSASSSTNSETEEQEEFASGTSRSSYRSGGDKSGRSAASASRSFDDDEKSRSSLSRHDNNNEDSGVVPGTTQQQQSLHSLGQVPAHSSSKNNTSFRGGSSSEIMNSFLSFEGGSSSADYTSGSDSTYNEESSGRSSSVFDDSSQSFSASWSPVRSNTMSNSKFAWPNAGISSQQHTPVKADADAVASPPDSIRSFPDANDVDPFATTPVGEAPEKAALVSTPDGFDAPPFPIDNEGETTEPRVATVGFDLGPKTNDGGSVSTSKRSNRSSRTGSHRKTEPVGSSTISMGSSKGSARKSTSTRSSATRSRASSSRSSKGSQEQLNQGSFSHSTRRSSSRSSQSDAFNRSADPSGLPPSRSKSYKLGTNYTSQSGSEFDDSSSCSSEDKEDKAFSSNDAFGSADVGTFPGSTNSFFSASSNLQSSSQDIEGFESFASVAGDDALGFEDRTSALFSKASGQSHSTASINSKSRDKMSLGIVESKSRLSRGKTVPSISRNTSSQSQTSVISSAISQGTGHSQQSSSKTNEETKKKESRMSISEFLPPRPIGNKQTSFMSGLTSKDTISRVMRGDEPSISLSEVFSQSPTQASAATSSNQSPKSDYGPTTPASKFSHGSDRSKDSFSTKTASLATRENESSFGEESFQPASVSSFGNDGQDLDCRSQRSEDGTEEIEVNQKMPSTSDLCDSAVAEDQTIFSDGTFGTVSKSHSETPADIPGNAFGASFNFKSVHSNFYPGVLESNFEGQETLTKASTSEQESPSLSKSVDLVASGSSSSSPPSESNTTNDEGTTNVSSYRSESRKKSSSGVMSNSHPPSSSSGSSSSYTKSERSSITFQSNKQAAASHTSSKTSKKSRSAPSSFTESSRTSQSASIGSRSPPSPFVEAPKSHLSQSSGARRSRRSSSNSRRSDSRRSALQKISPRPQSAGDSSHEGDSRSSMSYNSRSESWHSRDNHIGSAHMSLRSGSASIATYSSRSEESTGRTTRDRHKSLPASHGSRSRLSSSHRNSSRSRREDLKKTSSRQSEGRDTSSRRDVGRLPDVFSFGKCVSLLKDVDVGLKKEMKVIHATVSSRQFQNVVILAYEKLCQVRPRLAFLFSEAEWLHVHCLLLYSRLFDCELHHHKIDLPKEFQIEIPEGIEVFEPIAAVLSSIGIVEDKDVGVTYVPVAKPYHGNVVYAPHDPEDVTEFLEWTQKEGLGYDWNASWEKVERGRQERKEKASEQGVKLPMIESTVDSEKQEEKLRDWNLLAVEKWLGWDDDLWNSYKQACHVLSRVAQFCRFPRDVKTGTYAWLLPCQENDETGVIVRVPNANLSADTWMIALLFEFCAPPQMQTATWYIETNVLCDIFHVTSQFLESAIKLKSGERRLKNGEILDTVLED
jgi:trimeric autotransporter adhesin